MSSPHYPSLFQINTRVRLSELSATLGRAATLDDITDAELDQLARDGFDLVWLLGVWQTGEAARRVSMTHPDWLADYHRVLPDFRDADVTGSPFAIRDYHVHADFGGDEALAGLRERLRARGLRLVLDFVPNHVAPDHAWLDEHPEYLHHRERGTAGGGTAQLPEIHNGQRATHSCLRPRPVLRRVARHTAAELRECRAAGCPARRAAADRAPMRRRPLRHGDAGAARRLPANVGDFGGALLAPGDGGSSGDVPRFLFMAEVYWDLEWTLIQQGFDYAYDKRLYDRLEHGGAGPVRGHLKAGLDSRTTSHDSSRTMTSRVRPRRLAPPPTVPRR